MGIRTEFRDGILHAQVSGELTFDQAMQHLREIEQMTEGMEVLRELLDFAECENISLSSDQLRTTVSAGDQSLTRFTRYRLAIYAGDDLHYGLSRMFQIFHEIAKHEIELEIFRDRELALEWLRKS